MIIASERFHKCRAETLKIDFQKYRLNLVLLHTFSGAFYLFIFFNLEYASYILKSILLNFKAKIKCTLATYMTGTNSYKGFGRLRETSQI